MRRENDERSPVLRKAPVFKSENEKTAMCEEFLEENR